MFENSHPWLESEDHNMKTFLSCASLHKYLAFCMEWHNLIATTWFVPCITGATCLMSCAGARTGTMHCVIYACGMYTCRCHTHITCIRYMLMNAKNSVTVRIPHESWFRLDCGIPCSVPGVPGWSPGYSTRWPKHQINITINDHLIYGSLVDVWE